MTSMIDNKKIVEIAKAVASDKLVSTPAKSVSAEPFLDSNGEEGIKITITISSDEIDQIDGEEILNTLLEIGDRLSDAGEERRPSIRYEEIAA